MRRNKKKRSKPETKIVLLGKKASKSVERLAALTEWMLYLIGAALVGLFGYLQIRGENFQKLATPSAAKTVFHLAMFLYFTSWMFGSRHDLKDQKEVYLLAPNRGVPPFLGVTICVMIGVVFAVLCRVETEPQFVGILALMLLLNVGGWMYLRRQLVDGMIEESMRAYEQNNDYLSFEKLKLVKELMAGKWQWYRFGFGTIAIAVLGFALYPGNAETLAKVVPDASADLLRSAGILAFVVAFEGIMWYMRIRTRMGRELLEDFEEEYELSKKPGHLKPKE
jgi:hypothetical protein